MPSCSAYRFDLAPQTVGSLTVQAAAGVTASLGQVVNQPSNTLQYHYSNPGALRVNFEPDAVIAAGARWRHVGAVDWHMSDTVESTLAPGRYPIECKDLPLYGLTRPALQTGEVAALTTTTLIVHYTDRPVTVSLLCAGAQPVRAPFPMQARFNLPVLGAAAADLITTNAVVSRLSGMTVQQLLSVNGDLSVALGGDGQVLAWGGDGSVGNDIPANLDGVVAVAAGGFSFYEDFYLFAVAIKADGTVTAWGTNIWGQCLVPPGLNNVVAISAGGWHTLALRADGTVTAFGYNGQGTCAVPAGLHDVIAVSAGGEHSLALTADGTPEVSCAGCVRR